MAWRIVAQRVADGMVLSTGNLYFTAHDNAGARVFRTAQSATPGQEAVLATSRIVDSGTSYGRTLTVCSTDTSSPLPAA
jgi:hypothetical protein